MSNEALEAKLVQKTVAMLKMARAVIEKMSADEDEKGFKEEPSLSDLVLVAQIIGQTSTIDRLGEMGAVGEVISAPASLSQHLGPQPITVAVPDIFVMWSSEGWYVHLSPELQQEPRLCESPEELASVLQQMAVVCGEHRRSS